MKKLFICLLAMSIVLPAGWLRAQVLPIAGKWKFSTGDKEVWAQPFFNDSAWASIQVGSFWEVQGYENYDGFAWYRLHIVIPSSLRDKAFLKDKLRIELGKIDDGDQVYLNGFLIGQNAGQGGKIESGNFRLDRTYTLPLSDQHIWWDKDNVIAVRVYDGDGNGGMYNGPYTLSVMDVTDFVRLYSADFHFSDSRKFSKRIVLESSSGQYDFTGKLNIRLIDPFSGAVIAKQTIGADFALNRPFEYTFKATLPENKSYQLLYDFEEGRSGKLISAAEGVPYILTPPPSAVPRINGPEVYGARPGTPFLYKIAATGQKPVAYSAARLPKGLRLDRNTGIITGVIDRKGDYQVKLTVKNDAGVATRNFTILCGPTIGLTPAMGWNSWNCWGVSVSAEKVKQSADVMASGLADHGWSYVNIDDGWQDKRDSAGDILPNSKFPDMKGLSAYVHNLGLKIGIYSSPGRLTCGSFLGSYQHEEQDAAIFARWGMDYLKYDWCSYADLAPRAPGIDDYKKPYIVMRNALNKTCRDIIYSLCEYGMGDVWKWGGEIGANSWRTTGDIQDNWNSMAGIGFRQNKPAPFTAPGNFNDPDMLVVGKLGWGPNLRNTMLTPDEQYTHISLWALLSSPLLIGCDISQLDDFTLGLLTNDEVLAIDQDALAKPAAKAWEKGDVQVWMKPLKSGARAIGVFNLGEKPVKMAIPWAEIGLFVPQQLRDCWRQQDLAVSGDSYMAEVPAHGVVLLQAVGAR